MLEEHHDEEEIKINKTFIALTKFKRRKFKECIELCTEILKENQYDRAVWVLKCRAMTADTYVDDTDLEELGIADEIMDENTTASVPRPGTSIRAPATRQGAGDSRSNLSMRPASQAGRPMSGFIRPSTQQRNIGSSSGNRADLSTALKSRPGTSRPVTALGRQIRLGTASMVSGNDDVFINVEALDMQKYVSNPEIARPLCDYLLYHEHHPRKALELCALATKHYKFEDWWWKHRLAKCYYALGLFRDAEQQLKSIVRNAPIVDVYLELGKVYLRMDQPKNAMIVYKEAMEKYPESTAIVVAIARTHDMLLDEENALSHYKKVLSLDPSNIEATACLGAHYFYADQPEIALRFYRRLLSFTEAYSSSFASAELWNNIGLCCFYSSQYDLALPAFENALKAADDIVMSDIWYNLGHVAVSIGDLGLAYQCFKVAIGINPKNAEAMNNLGVLEIRKGNLNDAIVDFQTARKSDAAVYEPCYNGALLAHQQGDIATSYELATMSKEVYPDHVESKQLLANLKKLLSSC